MAVHTSSQDELDIRNVCHQILCNAMCDRASLTCRPAPAHERKDVERAEDAGELERAHDALAVDEVGEVRREGEVVYEDCGGVSRGVERYDWFRPDELCEGGRGVGLGLEGGGGRGRVGEVGLGGRLVLEGEVGLGGGLVLGLELSYLSYLIG